MAFVTNTSTSGFQVPGEAIVEEFGLDNTEDILDGAVFNNIEFGGSHQVSTAMLLGRNVDAAAFFDADLQDYFTLVEGEDWMPGAIYEVDEGAAAPFDDYVGEQIQIIQSTPVLNGPFVLNHDVLTDEEVENLIAAFTSDETANDERIFVDPEADQPGWFNKTADERFVEVEDSWYDPIRQMGGAE
jgi:phosphonate transport system substrate-binding protein